jgi:hypothetical protein
MDLDNLKIRPVHLAALFGIMPWALANMYLTLVVNWPELKPLISTLSLYDLGVVGSLNFYFCIYTLAVIVLLIVERRVRSLTLVCHGFIIFGFCVGIGIVYAVIYAVRSVVSMYIQYAVLLNSFLSLYGLFMFYVDLYLRWHRPNGENKTQPPITTY